VTAGPSIGRLTSRQVDVVLEIAVLVVVASGIASLAVGTSWGRGLTAVHGIGGLTILVLAPAKARGSVRTGLRRRRVSERSERTIGTVRCPARRAERSLRASRRVRQ
jgi:hypothetical protein